MHVGYKLQGHRNISVYISNCFSVATIGRGNYMGIILGYIVLSEIELGYCLSL